MQTAFRFILLLVHFAVAAVTVYYIGDLISQEKDMVSVLLLGLSLSLMMVSIIKHIGNFLSFIKNKTTQL